MKRPGISACLRRLVMLAVASLGSTSAVAAAECTDLRSLSLPYLTVTSASVVSAGSFSPPPSNANLQTPNFSDLAAFCRVTAVSRPSRDSEINIEVWLPLANWNTRFQPVGPGLWGGALNHQALATMLRAGYATATTDMGHTGSGASFALGHPEKVIDFGYRAFREMTLAAKAAILQFYGDQPSLSLVNQCGGAGRGALAEIQRFPDGYDLVAAAGIDPETTRHSMAQLWVWQATHKTPLSRIPPDKFPLLHRAALNACDANDGIADNIIRDPRSCKVDPAVLRCHGGDAPDCLTAAQVAAARMIYSPVVNPRTKQTLFGPLMPGSELGWGQLTADEPVGYGTDFFRYLVFKDPNWHPRTRPVDFDRDAAAADARENLVVNVEPNLNRFFDRGGKLLVVGGWADGAIPPASNTNFYERVVQNTGRRAEDSVRLFMVPDMGHCPAAPNAQNGYVVDTAGILETWHRTGQPPSSIVATRRVDGADERKLLVCRYPQVAHYRGTGDPKVPESFVCR